MKIIRMNLDKSETTLLTCKDVGVDSCVLSSREVRDRDILIVEFTCLEEKNPCDFSFKSYWSETYPVVPGKPLKIDFEHEAYAKLFSLDLTNQVFKEVRILLQAETFLAGTTPIRMFANYGGTTPAENKHDIESVHLWDDGQGIFLVKEKMKNHKLTLLIEGPAENVLNLHVTLVNE